jgi:PAS domain S-box-containing protein
MPAEPCPPAPPALHLLNHTDWSANPLGPPEDWPAEIRILVRQVMAAQFPMWVAWGPDLRMVYNDAYCAILGAKHPSSWAMPVRAVWSEILEQIEPLLSSTLAGISTPLFQTTFEIVRGDQPERVRFNFALTPVSSEDGQVIGIFCAITENTLLIQAQETAELENQRLERAELSGRHQLAAVARERARILEMSRDLFAVASFEGRLLSINPAWASQLGRTEAELLAKPFAEIIHPDDVEETGRVVQTLMLGESVHQFHVRLMKADGSFIVYAWSAVPETDPPNGTFYTVGRDITEEQTAAAELRATQEALRHAQKMEAVGQLTGGLAHDFNNLLGSVSASLQVLKAHLERGKTKGLERYVAMGQDAIRRAASLTHRLLAFSRRQTLDPRPVDVNRLLADMEGLVRGSVGPSVELRIAGIGGLWHVNVDASQLENSLLNLCINARDAMLPDGGRLSIETANEVLDARTASAHGLRQGQYISVCITDTGSGMSEEVQTRAFDPFFTTKPLGEGTGLGLSMVHGFARQSGGHATIRSQLGSGTSVCLFLPRYLGSVEGNAEVVARQAAGVGAGETVVLIEDEPTIRVLVTEVLQDGGYRVIAADDGPAGLAILEEEGPVDLLITDVGLPGGLNGRQVADAARVRRPELKVLFITGYAENAAVGNGLMGQGMEVLTKPFQIEELAKRVGDMVNTARRSALS